MSQKNKATEISKILKAQANPQRAAHSARYFKTGPGEYADGDIFLGIPVPALRKIVSQFTNLPIEETEKLLHSAIHEERLIALLILVKQFAKATPNQQKEIFDSYLANTKYINNWDLVDTSAPNIIGTYTLENPSRILFELAHSKNLWERRIAMISTFPFIRKKQSEPALKIAKILLKDPHDLTHKVTGWMLREIGKNCSKEILANFLKENYHNLPRTTLRYAIEKFPEPERKKWLEILSTCKFNNDLVM